MTMPDSPTSSMDFARPVCAWVRRHEGHTIVRVEGGEDANRVLLYLACLDCRKWLAYDHWLRRKEP